MPTIDLRKTSTAPPAKQPTKDWATEAEITDNEKKLLLTTGWKAGDPIPRPLLESIRADLKRNIGVGLPADEKIVNIADLSQEEKQKVLKAMTEAHNARVEMKAIGGDISGLEGVLDPSIIAAMEATNKLNTAPKTVEVKEAPKETVPESAGAEQKINNCPHCGWNLSHTDDEEFTEADKWAFVQAVLGGQRFVKQYNLFDGRLQVVFRSLTTDEADLAFTQASLDVHKGVMPDEQTYMRTLMDYRMAMSIESIKSTEGITSIPPTLSDDFKTDTPPKGMTKLCFIMPYVYENVLKTESMRRAVGASFYRFQRLVEKLEARADDSDFWKAIEQPR